MREPLIKEEARSDAFAYGEDPFDERVVENYINQRKDTFGSKGTI
jgi:hypothetical protein